jgi:hypothetical protein
MNTDPQSPAFQEIRPTRDIPPAELAAGAWTGLTDDEARILADTPKSNRMTKLRELRPALSHNQRKQLLKRRGLR